MAALRAKYQGRDDIEPRKADSAPTMSVPPARTTMTPAYKGPPPEDLSEAALSEPSAEDQAAQSAIKQRLNELERAENVSQEPQQPRFATENQPRQPSLMEQRLAQSPEAARGWLRAHPDFMTDPEKNAQIQHAHFVAVRESGEEFSPNYFARLEHHLGLRQPQRQPQQSSRPASRPAVPRQTQVSAPPTRESVSLSNGRPTSDNRVNLTGEEREFAAMCGMTDQEYAAEKLRMLRTQQ